MKNLKITMRNTLYLVLVLLICVGCYPTEVHETVNRTKHINIETEVIVKRINSSGDYKIITIDGCEYIEHHYHGESGVGIGIVHKGNCKYCAKRALAN